MKKTISFFLFALCCLTSFAQLKVYTNGNVGVKSSLSSTNSCLNIGNRSYGDSKYNVFLTSSNPATGSFNIGVDGWSYPSSVRTEGRTIGVRGIAGNCTSGFNYGVIGALRGNHDGAAIYGAFENLVGSYVDGRYAGYFCGDVKSTGATKAFLVNIYDTENLIGSDDISALEILDSLEALTNSIPDFPPFPYDSLIHITGDGEGNGDPHIGVDHFVISPRPSLRNACPNLFITDSNNREYVNYTELIPLLVAAVKDLKSQLSALQQSSNTFPMETDDVTLSGMTETNYYAACRLYQNSPNPFSGNTVIKYALPEDVSDALICVFNMQGTMLSQTPVSGSSDRITINGSDYGPGMYIYSLIVNGREVDSKRMILTK